MSDLALHVNLDSATEIVQEFSETVDKTKDLNNLKLPFVLKNKILMSPGKWNGMTYTANTIREAYESSDFADKTICGLYHDHLDGIGSDGEPSELKVTDWVGDVTNVHMDGDILKGDLNVLDKQTAIKLAYGAKFGISPSVKGIADEHTDNMLKFRFNNYGIVVNPAIKTAYINNAQITGMEAERKKRKMSVADFYAIPRDPPSASKLPMFDAAHVRNALARISQVTGVTQKERETAINKLKKAAEKFKITISESKKEMGDNMAEPDVPKEPKKEEEPKETETPEQEPKVEDKPKEETKEEKTKETKKEMSLDVLSVELSEIKSMLSQLSEIVGVLKENSETKPEVKENAEETPVEEPKTETPVETPTEESTTVETKEEMNSDVKKVTAEMSEKATIEELQTKVKELEKKNTEPVRLTQELGETQTTEIKSTGDVDQDLVNLIQGKQ